MKRNLIRFILNLDALRTFKESQKVECALLCKNIGESFVFKKCVASSLMKDKFYLNWNGCAKFSLLIYGFPIYVFTIYILVYYVAV